MNDSTRDRLLGIIKNNVYTFNNGNNDDMKLAFIAILLLLTKYEILRLWDINLIK